MARSSINVVVTNELVIEKLEEWIDEKRYDVAKNVAEEWMRETIDGADFWSWLNSRTAD